jgi:hypothetical protein
MPVPDFSPGEVLTAAAMDSIGLWLVKTQTIGTGVSSVPVTDAFSANYDNYLVTINGGAASSDGDMRMSLGASGTGYKNQILYATYNNTPLAFSPTASQWNYVGSSGTNELQARFEVFSPFTTKFTKCSSQYANSAAFVTFGGIHEVAASYTGFTLTPSVGTLTGGIIRIYGYRN